MQDDSSFQAHWGTFFKEGKTVIVPIDHGTAIPVPGLEDPSALIRSLNPFADGYVVNFGLGRACGEALEGKGVCFRTDVYKPAFGDNANTGSTRMFSVDDGFEIGANAVMNMFYLHHPQEDRIYRECAALVSECIDAGLPVILESLPFGIGCGDKYTPENIGFAVRAAAELGADVVKTAYPTGSVDDFRAIVESCFVPVVVLGGAAMGNDAALFEMVRNSMDAGAAGIALGRNVWQHAEPAKIARSLHALVHEDASVASALKLMGDVQEFFTQNQVRNYYSVSISGYHIAEAGANPISQAAFTLANGFTFVEYYLARGMNIDDFAPNLSFFFSNGMDPEYTVIGRVARRIWAVAMREKYGANSRSQKLKYHIQTSGRSLPCHWPIASDTPGPALILRPIRQSRHQSV